MGRRYEADQWSAQMAGQHQVARSWTHNLRIDSDFGEDVNAFGGLSGVLPKMRYAAAKIASPRIGVIRTVGRTRRRAVLGRTDTP
jgi:hypothetical protein